MSLRRRLFVAFGVGIALSGLVFVGVARLLRPEQYGPLATVLTFLAAAIPLWAVAGVVARRIARPLASVADLAQAIGEGDLSRRYDPGRGGGREVTQLATSLNEMAERIGKQLADQRELLAAVSHELRTPLGHLQLLIELAQQQDGQLSVERLGEMEREVREIDELVGDLLAHSRLEFSGPKRSELDAVALAAEALERQGLPAELLDSERESWRFEGDASLLARALANLLDNGQRHGGGVCALRLRGEQDEQGQLLRFEVDDGGPGFADDLDQPFEAFVGGAGHGLGLGLALVARIAEAHGGDAWAEHREGGGARVTLSVAI
jgi:two-component system OmpR family sensor kinase